MKKTEYFEITANGYAINQCIVDEEIQQIADEIIEVFIKRNTTYNSAIETLKYLEGLLGHRAVVVSLNRGKLPV